MADQTVRIEGDSGTTHNVAFKLWLATIGNVQWSTADDKLDHYVDCLSAVHGSKAAERKRG